MRKLTGLMLATSLTVVLVAGCGAPAKQDMVNKLNHEAETLQTQNYKSTALMTVQMDNSSQTYSIETWYEGPDTYKILLGDANKNVNQIIVRNKSGMFIVSPSLQKVFRFNGNWAQNQSHIYLYDQIIKQITSEKNLKISKSGNNYAFVLPVNNNDVVKTERVEVDAKTLQPSKVTLYDKAEKAVVTIDFQKFETGVKFSDADFDPHKMVNEGTKTTTAPVTTTQTPMGYIEPNQTFGDQLTVQQPEEQDDTLLRYVGDKSFTLEEWRPSAGSDGLPNGELVDLFGVPALLTGANSSAHQLIWLNNGVEYDLASSQLTLPEMTSVAVSTFGQVGK